MSLVPGLNVPEGYPDSPSDPFWWFLPPPLEIDPDALDRVWAALDRRLAARPFNVRRTWADAIEVQHIEILGLIAVDVERAVGDVTCWYIDANGTRRRIGRGWSLEDPFAHGFWLRFAFQRWAPHLSRMDFVDDPLLRPAQDEIETGRQLRRRLTVDRRYWRMCDDFVAALAIPPAVLAEAARLGKPTHADGISELWWPSA